MSDSASQRELRDDLEYSSDGIRDVKQDLGKPVDEQAVQASMQEETAKAMHRVAVALEKQNEMLEALLADQGVIEGDDDE